MKERQRTQQRHIWLIHQGTDGRMLMTSGQVKNTNTARFLRRMRGKNSHARILRVPISTSVPEIPNISDVLFLLVEGKRS